MAHIPDFPDDENGDVLRQMAEQGDDLSVPRNIDFTLVFPDEERAQRFAAAFSPAYPVTVDHSEVDEDCPWDVVVVNHMAPDHAAITAFEERLRQVAEPLGGRNDGWGCFSQDD
ncbi:ribonuclease E inhibitor RraB [Pseudoduganella sp. GCM10020061]|uniref:ribonuclease E inhibitor RraB n=1 Tax=Pseudoduganella sp. GCM10020061 TaxID=3317345 RepID=UPI0036279E0A